MGAIKGNSDISTPLINSDSDTITIKSSGFRWMVLLGLSSQNIFSGILWISLAPIANHAISYYNMTAYSLNAINLIFPLLTVLLGLATAALINIFGVRLVLGTGILCNLTCAFIRLCSTWLTQSFSRFVLLVVAQVIAAIAQPFCLFAPTKLALVWFPDTQRTTATTIASLANSLGVLIGSAYPPLLVKKPSDIPSLDASLFGIALFVALLTLPAFWRARPPNPPSVASAAFQDIEHRRRLEHGSRYVGFQLTCFLKSTWIVMKNRGFLLLAFGFAAGLAYFTAVSALFQQMLCATGYSNEFAGLCGALMIGSGIIVAFLVSLIVGKTGSILYGIKVCFALAALGAIGFSVTVYFPGCAVLIGFFVAWFGGFGFSIYGLSLEMAAEATYPVPEMVTTGLSLILSQLLSIILIMIMQIFAPVIRDSPLQTCGPDVLVKSHAKVSAVYPTWLLRTVITPLAILSARPDGLNTHPWFDPQLTVDDLDGCLCFSSPIGGLCNQQGRIGSQLTNGDDPGNLCHAPPVGAPKQNRTFFFFFSPKSHTLLPEERQFFS